MWRWVWQIGQCEPSFQSSEFQCAMNPGTLHPGRPGTEPRELAPSRPDTPMLSVDMPFIFSFFWPAPRLHPPYKRQEKQLGIRPSGATTASASPSSRGFYSRADPRVVAEFMLKVEGSGRDGAPERAALSGPESPKKKIANRRPQPGHSCPVRVSGQCWIFSFPFFLFISSWLCLFARVFSDEDRAESGCLMCGR